MPVSTATPTGLVSKNDVSPNLSERVGTQQNKTDRARHLGRTFLLVWGIAMGASILGAMAGGGVTVELLITKAITYAIAGAIIVGLIKAFRALR